MMSKLCKNISNLHPNVECNSQHRHRNQSVTVSPCIGTGF